ncbi:MAG TPA: hypothetical protein VGF59_23165, partial [Bryobacteraceae bacterium]
SVAPGTHYTFQGWSADWSNDQFGSPAPANFQVLINGAVVATVAQNPTDGAWTQFTAQWDSQGATQATIQIVDTVLENAGNDFALDDLSFTGTPGCTVTVTAVHMLNPHTLAVQAQGTFTNSSSSKSLGVSATVNGTVLKGAFMLPPGQSGQQSHVFTLDLAAGHAPKFQRNAAIPVTASLAEQGGSSCTSAAVSASEPLPTLIVPDIRSGNGGDGTYPALEAYLTGPLPAGALGDPYTRGVTLRTLAYDTDRGQLTEGASALSRLIDQVLSQTWASKVNVIAYGRGGLVLRSYLSPDDDHGHQGRDGDSAPAASRVNQAIFCVTPHSGTPWPAVNFTLPASLFYGNMLPTYDWVRATTRQDFADFPPNIELQRLNRGGLAAGPAYSIFYSSSSLQTPVTQTIAGNVVGKGAGDDVVPAFSQMGQTFDPDHPATPPAPLPGFANVFRESIPGTHFGYPANPAVMSELARCLRNNSCQ